MDGLAELLGRGGATRLGRDAAEACIAERLEALDRPADLLTPEAVDALIAYANGSLPRLRAALTSTLFLGATEEATRIDRDVVARAIQDTGSATRLPPEPEGGFPRAEYRGGLGSFLLAGAGTLAVAAVMVIGWAVMTTQPREPAPVLAGPALHQDAAPARSADQQGNAAPPGGTSEASSGGATPTAAAPAGPVSGSGQPPEQAAAQPAGPVSGQPPAQAQGADATVPVPSPPAGYVPAPGDAPQAAQLPPPVSVGTPPLPPSAQPLPSATQAQSGPPTPVAGAATAPANPNSAQAAPATPQAAPAAPDATVVLRFRARDPEAMFKLGVATQQLRSAGYTRIYSWPLSRAPEPGTPVRYFFSEDSQTAQSVAGTLSSAAGKQAPPAETQLVVQKHARHPHPPGTIEVLIR